MRNLIGCADVTRSLRPYLTAVIAVVIALTVRLALAPAFGDELPYITLLAAVAIASALAAGRAGLLATALGAVSAWLLFVAPTLSADEHWVGRVIGLTLFCAIGVSISFFAERMHRARERAGLEADRLGATLRSIGDGVIVTDAEGRVESLNPVAERLTGWSAQEARGRELDRVFRVDSRGGTDAGAGALAGPCVLLPREGREVPIEGSSAPIFGETGSSAGAVVVFREVSDPRTVETALRRSDDELADLFENAGVALHWVDGDGIVLGANRAALELFGRPAHEFVGHPIAEFHADQRVIAGLVARLAAGESLRAEPAQLRARDGSLKDVVVSSSSRRDEAGGFVDSRCITVDVTQQRQADRMRGLLAAVVESSEDAVISKTLDGRVLSWNDGARAMFGYSADEIIGRSVDVLIPEEERPQERNALSRVANGEHVGSVETVRIARDGRRIDVSLTLSPIRDQAGVIIGASSIARDIGLRKQLEASLREADRRKDEFLAVLAHELRNPLAPIRNSVAVLQLAELSEPNLRRVVEVIERQSGHMSRLLDDLLDVSRITRNELSLRKQIVSLQVVLDLALEASQPTIDASDQELSISMPPEPIFVHADAMRLAQVFSNLLNNASKYSDPGKRIWISTSVADGEVLVSVVDEGIGIAPAALPNLFNMFSQAPDALDRAQGGLGIGLALVKGLVELHGGRVCARSEGLGLGSSFEVRLAVAPRRRAVSAPPSFTGPRAANGRRVLIADDNRDGAESLALALRRLGHEVRTAHDGAAAVEEAETFRPEVVLLDLGMPKVDGFEAARRLRGLPWSDRILLVAVTGWGQARDRRRTALAGFDAHLVKPVDLSAIQALLSDPVPR